MLRIAFGCVLALCLACLDGCVYISSHTLKGACSNDLGSPIRNFCVVSPGVFWRGERPTRSDAHWLVEHGVRTVVSLQLDVRHAFASAAPDPDLASSIDYFQVKGFNAIQVLTHAHLDEHVALVLAILEEAPKPIYVSCRAGVDRTGLMAAAYEVLVEGTSRNRAIAEMDRFGSPWDPLNARYVRSLTAERAADILRHVHDWRGRLRPNGMFRCAHGRCRYQALGEAEYAAW